MKRFYYTLLLFLPLNFLFCQKTGGQNLIATGDVLVEPLKLTDSSGKTVTVRLPSDTCILFYRLRGQNWLMDTQDSIAVVEQIAQELQKSSYTFHNLRLICYSYNQDKFLNSFNRPVFKKSTTYTVDYYYLIEKNVSRVFQSGKIVVVDRKGRVLVNSPYLGNYKYTHKDENKVLKGKLLTEKNGTKIPLSNAMVYLLSGSKADSVPVTHTDKYGDFELMYPDNSQQRTLRVEPLQKNVETIILATQQGVEQGRFYRHSDGVEFKLIEADYIRLSDINVDEDIGLAMANFLKTKEREFKRSEFIIYKVGSYKMEEDSKKILDKIAILLSENPKVRLEVISHTDAQSDHKSNLELSEKRSLSVVSYLVFIGVNKNRLTYSGKGETEIRNRCKDGVDCSDIEHGYNRRTEFRFVKE